MTQSRMTRRLISSPEDIAKALKAINFPRLPITVLSYPLGRWPHRQQKFKKVVGNMRHLTEAVEEALKASEIHKAVLEGWPQYKA